MNSKFNDFFSKIESLDDAQMLQIVAKAERELNKEFFPQILIVSNPSAGKEVMESIGGLIGPTDAVLDDLINAESDYIVRLQYGDVWNENVSDDTSGNTDIANISVPWAALKSSDILWVCGSSLDSIPHELIISSDRLLLVTNAAMAMTQKEKDWLTSLRDSIFIDEPVTVSLYNKHSINTQEDVDDLCENVTKLVARYGENTGFIDDIGNALSGLFENIDNEQLKAKREKRILTACFDSLEIYIKSQLILAETDIDMLNEAIKKIKAERENIEFSSRLILNSTIENMYGELKNKIIAAADRYSDDAYESIKARLAVSKTVEKDISNIAPYLKSVWANFEREIGKHVASEQEQIAGILEQQISSDCRKMVDILAISSFDETMIIPTASSVPEISFGYIDESQAKKNRMLSKGILITSIALAFVNPLWSLVGIAGTHAFTLANSKNLEAAKAKVLSELSDECNSIKRNVESQIESAIENAKKESGDNVLKIYSTDLDNLMAAIFRYMEQIKASKEKAAILQNILGNELPEAKAALK